MRWGGPSTNFVKRTTCAACGAPKQLPSPTAYLYCDFCGQLCDWDLRRACEDPTSARPGPAYEAMVRRAAPDLAQAKAAGDQARYRDLQQWVFTGYVTHCPKSIPPRAWNDQEYRAGYVRYLAECAVVTDFDPLHSSYSATVDRLVAQLRWGPGMRVDPPTFWPLLDTVLAQHARRQEVIAASGVVELDPDGSPAVIGDRIARSMLAQGWLPTLDDDDGRLLLERLGISHDYVEAVPPGAHAVRHCGGCGADLVALPGATCVVCGACGRKIDLHAAEVGCAGCGGTLSFPVSVARVPCPYCQAEARRVGW